MLVHVHDHHNGSSRGLLELPPLFILGCGTAIGIRKKLLWHRIAAAVSFHDSKIAVATTVCWGGCICVCVCTYLSKTFMYSTCIHKITSSNKLKEKRGATTELLMWIFIFSPSFFSYCSRKSLVKKVYKYAKVFFRHCGNPYDIAERKANSAGWWYQTRIQRRCLVTS